MPMDKSNNFDTIVVVNYFLDILVRSNCFVISVNFPPKRANETIPVFEQKIRNTRSN